MITEYTTIHTGGEGIYEEKKSRFIARTAHVECEEDITAFLESIRKEFYDARHHCYAYIYGKDKAAMRCSDDGEPSQTAGKPILDVMTGAGITDSLIVVTRYFGGTLLGTGGLVRSYSSAAKEGLAASSLMTRRLADRMSVRLDYNSIGKLQYMARQENIVILDTVYAADVTALCLVPVQETERFKKKLTEAFSGRADLEVQDTVFYGEENGRTILFPV